MKKSDLDKQLSRRIAGRAKGASVADRFGAGAASVPDRREQRRLDAAAGLVAFACKLPGDLATQLHARAATHAGGINGLVAELLRKGL